MAELEWSWNDYEPGNSYANKESFKALPSGGEFKSGVMHHCMEYSGIKVEFHASNGWWCLREKSHEGPHMCIAAKGDDYAVLAQWFTSIEQLDGEHL